jgi:hypothetical protein
MSKWLNQSVILYAFFLRGSDFSTPIIYFMKKYNNLLFFFYSSQIPYPTYIYLLFIPGFIIKSFKNNYFYVSLIVNFTDQFCMKTKSQTLVVDLDLKNLKVITELQIDVRLSKIFLNRQRNL